MKTYYAVKETELANFILVETYYLKSRGYFLRLLPVKRESRDGCTLESYCPFDAKVHSLLPCDRQSKKRAAQADEFAAELIPDLIRIFAGAYNLELI